MREYTKIQYNTVQYNMRVRFIKRALCNNQTILTINSDA